MKPPKGLTEEEVLDIMAKTVAYLAPSFRFGYFDTEDMKQEGTIFCLEALDSFRFEKSCQDDVGDALLTFLKTHVRWRFLNMRRKQLTRLEPPLCSCELCKEDSSNRLDCRKYSNWVKRNMAKKSLMEPFDVQEVYNSDASFTTDIELDMLSADVVEVLNHRVPVSIRGDYRRFIEGVTLPKNRREKVIKEIKEIIHTHYSKKIAEHEDR